MNINQTNLLKKLSWFVSLPANSTSIPKEQKEFIESLSAELKAGGHCFGFALCRGAMVAIGKGRWWEEALIAIGNSTEDAQALDQEVKLPESNHPITLRQIFERVLNYVVSTQANSAAKVQGAFQLTDTSQMNILSQEQLGIKQSHKRFEIIGKLNKNESKESILTIQHTVKIAGNFTKENLLHLLDENNFKPGCFCLIHSFDHTIEYDYENGTHNLYDPNYYEKFCHPLANKNALVNKIFSILKVHPTLYLPTDITEASIVIDYVSLNPEVKFDTSYYQDLVKNHPFSLIKDLGLRILTKELRDIIPGLMENILKLNDSKGIDILIDALNQKYNGYSCLARMAFLIPDTFKKVLEYASQSEKIYDCVANSIISQAEFDGCTSLHDVALFSPKNLPILFEYAEKAKDGKNKIALALVTKNLKGQTGLDVIKEQAPYFYDKAFSYYKSDYYQENALVETSALHHVAEAKGGHDKIGEALTNTDDTGRSGLIKAINHSKKETWETALKYAEQSESWKDLAANLLTKKEHSFGCTAFQQLIYNGSDIFSRILNKAALSNQGTYQILLALSSKDNDGLSGRKVLKGAKPIFKDQLLKAFALSLKNIDPIELKNKISNDFCQSKSPYYNLFRKYNFLHSLYRSRIRNDLACTLIDLIEKEIQIRVNMKKDDRSSTLNKV